jgi:hypothetical protein
LRKFPAYQHDLRLCLSMQNFLKIKCLRDFLKFTHGFLSLGC